MTWADGVYTSIWMKSDARGAVVSESLIGCFAVLNGSIVEVTGDLKDDVGIGPLSDFNVSWKIQRLARGVPNVRLKFRPHGGDACTTVKPPAGV